MALQVFQRIHDGDAGDGAQQLDGGLRQIDPAAGDDGTALPGG